MILEAKDEGEGESKKRIDSPLFNAQRAKACGVGQHSLVAAQPISSKSLSIDRFCRGHRHLSSIHTRVRFGDKKKYYHADCKHIKMTGLASPCLFQYPDPRTTTRSEAKRYTINQNEEENKSQAVDHDRSRRETFEKHAH